VVRCSTLREPGENPAIRALVPIVFRSCVIRWRGTHSIPSTGSQALPACCGQAPWPIPSVVRSRNWAWIVQRLRTLHHKLAIASPPELESRHPSLDLPGDQFTAARCWAHMLEGVERQQDGSCPRVSCILLGAVPAR